MNLASILAFFLLGFGWSRPLAGSAAQAGQQQTPAAADSNSPAPQSQGSPSTQQAAPTVKSAQPAPASTSQKPKAAGHTKPSAKRRRAKKAIYPDCLIGPTALNPTVGNSGTSLKATRAAPTKAGGATGSASSNSSSTNSGTAARGSTKGSAKPGSAALKPCPPPKKVVRNGGSDEPAIQLQGGTPAELASNERSTEQLTAATEENLKKIAGRQLNSSQQDMVSQIKEFVEQSKQAIAAGDPERGHNLAMKARLLSDELVKP